MGLAIELSRYIEKAMSMTKHERVMRVCNLGVKQELNMMNAEEAFELAAIQSVRELYGELEEVLRNRVID